MPLVHREHAVDVLAAFFKWVFGTAENATSLRLDQVPVSGLFADVLSRAAAAAGLPVRRLDSHERAVLAVPESVDDYLTDALPRKRRKEFRRLRARLGEQGKLEVRQFKPGDDLTRWLNEFYALEGRGWKGRAGTSLSCDPAWSGFFDVAFAEFEAGGDVLIWKLTLDGAPVAMILGAGGGRRAWLFKIAHDENYARYSPGVLVVLDAMEALARAGEFDMIDSCAQADHPMINHLWRERLQLHDVMIGRPGQAAPVFGMLYLLTRFKRAARALSKRLYRQFFKRGAK